LAELHLRPRRACNSSEKLREQFVDQFTASFVVPPRRLTFDLDAADDPTHGDQQLYLTMRRARVSHGGRERCAYLLAFRQTSRTHDEILLKDPAFSRAYN
jgi:hypothetical protein